MASPPGNMDEDETCKRYVLSALNSAGWAADQIRAQFQINNGPIGSPGPESGRIRARLDRPEDFSST